MFATPAILALLIFIYIRPQEIFLPLGRVPLLYLLVGLALVGLALDVRLGFSRIKKNPILPWAIAHLAWNLVSMLVNARHALGTHGVALAVAFIIFFVISQGVQTFRGLSAAGVGMLAVSLFVVLVGLHQAFAPLGCVRQDDVYEDRMTPIGAACKTTQQCRDEHDEQDLHCEHIGLVGTTSVGGRVRYRGLMQDPNELAMVSSMAIPFAFALFELRRTIPRLLLAIVTFGAVAVVTLETKSRSGQLAFAAVLGVYLLRRLRWLGVVLAVAASLPILMLGGRGGSEADESSELRLGYWAAAIQMARDSPLVGVGMSMFTDHQPQTAHSSIMLALGETGVPGLFFWTALLYAACKIGVVVLRRETSPEAHPAQVWATAMLATLAAFLTSALFLSLTYHYVLWILLGLVGALYAATVRHDPRLTVRFGIRDLAAVGGIDSVLVLALHFYTRSKGF
jgi:hypothetical protein